MISQTSSTQAPPALLLAVAALAAAAPALCQLPAVPGTHVAAGSFLVASRNLRDPNFAETVILLIDHDDHGAMGLVINRPLPVSLGRLFPDTEVLKDRRDPVYRGGPVERGRMVLLIRADSAPDGTDKVADKVTEGVFFSGSRDLLEALAAQGEKAVFRVYAGYAGWAPGQLEREIARGGWHLLPADEATVFSEHPEALWDDLIQRASGKWVDRSPEGSPPGGDSLAEGLAFTPTRWSPGACW